MDERDEGIDGEMKMEDFHLDDSAPTELYEPDAKTPIQSVSANKVVEIADGATQGVSCVVILPGMRFDTFEAVERLGRGGMGEVWKCRDLEADRMVAIKVVPCGIPNYAEMLQRVRSVFAKVHELQHQYIGPIYAMKQHRNVGDYLVMKYITGEPLNVYWDRFAAGEDGRHRVPICQTMRIMEMVADALDYAHRQDVLHRDIKPGNIMVRATPSQCSELREYPSDEFSPDESSYEVDDVQIIDFGLAMRLRHDPEPYHTAGTGLYMAPEQWTAAELDGRTDQFSLAVVLYELLAGQTPFRGKNPSELMRTILNDDPEPIAGYSANFNEVLAKALSKRREDRWPSCRTFVRHLHSAASSQNEPFSE